MQKPTAPSFAVDEWPARNFNAPCRSFSAWAMLRAMKSLPAVSGSSAVLPWYRSGARPEKPRSEEHTSELQSLAYLVCRLLLEKKKRCQLRRAVHHDTRG